MNKITLLSLSFLLGIGSLQSQVQSGFEFANYDTLKVINGSDGKTTGYYGNADNNGTGKYFYVPIEWDTSFGGYWKSGWALSKVIDTTEESSNYTKHLFAARPGNGARGVFDQAWALGQNGSKLYFIDPATGNNLISNMGLKLNSFYYTNTTFAYNSMLFGDFVGKKFGGSNGQDPDFFTLTVLIHGKNIMDNSYQCDTMVLPLADFTFSDSTKDYIVKNWKLAEVTRQLVDSMEFRLSSSDVGDWGMNTPAFFALDALEFSMLESTQAIPFNGAVSLYPNPVASQVRVDVDAKPLGIQCIDNQGRNIRIPVSAISETADGVFRFQADVEFLSDGIYRFVILTNQGVVTLPFVKN